MDIGRMVGHQPVIAIEAAILIWLCVAVGSGVTLNIGQRRKAVTVAAG